MFALLVLRDSATVFRFDGVQWNEEQEFLHPNPSGTNFFGSAIAIDNDTIIAGAPGNRDVPGQVYVYRFDGQSWFLEQVLSGPSGVQGFGTAVSIFEDTALVGSIAKAFVFRRQGSAWTMEHQFVQPGVNSPSFGSDVAIHGDVVAIVDSNSEYRGVYLYRFDGASWSLEETIDGYTYPGSAISLTGNALAVAGGLRVFVFRFNGSGWPQEAALAGTSAFSLKSPISLTADSLLTSGTLPDLAGDEYPAVFVFRRTGSTWFQESVLSTPSGDYDDVFGWSVSLDDGVALIGASGVDVSQYQDNSGAAYVYMLDKSGACCDRKGGTCTSCQLETECAGPDFLWTRSRDCSETSCSIALGACCDHQVDGNPTASHCTYSTFADCNCPTCQWNIDADCSDVACEPTYGAIPTVTEWGLIFLTLSLLIAAKTTFARRTLR